MISEWRFGTRANGQAVTAYKLASDAGFQAVILDCGATLQSFHLPDGRNITLGFETWEQYETDTGFKGRIIGPNANRIRGAQFQIDDISHALTANEGAHNLHSGPDGFDTQMWSVTRKTQGLILRHSSPDGYNGFPACVDVTLDISLLKNKLRLEMQAKTDRPTPVNLTWHPYWNLSRDNRIDGHDLQITADMRSELEGSNPIKVEETRHDFRAALPLGGVKLDANYKDVSGVTLTSNQTSMRVTSSLPDMQVYTGDALIRPRAGIAIEPQYQPNDINLTQDSLLRPNTVYKHWIEYQFETH